MRVAFALQKNLQFSLISIWYRFFIHISTLGYTTNVRISYETYFAFVLNCIKDFSRTSLPLRAVDPDTGAPSVTYRLSGGDPSLFSVHPRTGVVRAVRGLDFEGRRKHELVIGTEEDMVSAAAGEEERKGGYFAVNYWKLCLLLCEYIRCHLPCYRDGRGQERREAALHQTAQGEHYRGT